MSIEGTYNRSYGVVGLSFNAGVTISSDLAIPWSISLAAAKTGTLSTRSDDNTGTLTMEGGHGITTGSRLDVYWATGSRRGVTVGTVSGTSVPIDLGSGDNLPAQSTAVTAMPSEEALAVTGNNAVAVAVNCPVGGTVVFAASNNSEIYARVQTSSVPSFVWTENDGGTNPLADATVAKVFLSHGSSAAASILSGVVQYD